MIRKLGQRDIWKLLVYFSYLCAQVLILGALMLTTTNMIAHTIMMILTIGFYFAVCFKDPGIYIANQQPNMEDISCSQKDENPVKNMKKKIVSDNIYQKDTSLDKKKEENKLILDEVRPNDNKRTSIQQKDSIFQNEDNKKQQMTEQKSPPLSQQRKQGEQKQIIPSARNILDAAKNVYGNLKVYLSKKNIEPAQQQKSGIKQKVEQEVRMKQVSIKQEKKEEEPIKLLQSNAEDKICLNFNEIIINYAKTLKTPLCQRLQLNKRYCRICQFYLPMRVRHCHSCDQCISTFDHHCPWLSTCIGEKNKLLFLIYILFQTLQFLVIFIDLTCYLAQNHSNKTSVGILMIAVILILVVLILLLAFHLYLSAHNLTTWELFKWEKIQYLACFDKQQLSSPFSKGWKQNFKTLWKTSVQPEHKQWEKELSEQLQKYLLKSKLAEKQQGTERKMFFSHQNI